MVILTDYSASVESKMPVTPFLENTFMDGVLHREGTPGEKT